MPKITTDQVITIANMIVPDILAFVREHQKSKGTIPTDEEVQAHIQSLGDKVISDIDAWQAAHPTPPDQP